MSRECGTCNILIEAAENCNITCIECGLLFHWNCVNITTVEADLLDDKWLCNQCETKRRRRFSSSDTPLKKKSATMRDFREGEVTDAKSLMEHFVSELKSEIQKVLDGQKKMERDINASLDIVRKKQNDNEQKIQEQDLIISRHQETIDQLLSENEALKKDLEGLKNDLAQTKQRLRCNVVEIRGLPLRGEESVYDAIKNLGKVLNFDVRREMIEQCFQMRKLKSIEHPTIIVKFKNRIDKDNFVRSKRFKKNLNTKHLGMSSSTPIYINESLTQEKRILLGKVKTKKLDHGWKHVWVSSVPVKTVTNTVLTTPPTATPPQAVPYSRLLPRLFLKNK